jgi:hypothetical protein
MPQIPADYRPLEASERKPRPGAKRTGSADPNQILTVSIRVRRRSDAPPLPIPTTARRRQHLSREDFAARYGASQDDLARIAGFAATNGLSVIESSIPRRTVVLKGSVAQMNRAFGVDLGLYETADEKYRGREGSIHLPGSIRRSHGIILVSVDGHVRHSDNRKRGRLCRRSQAGDEPQPQSAMYQDSACDQSRSLRVARSRERSFTRARAVRATVPPPQNN